MKNKFSALIVPLAIGMLAASQPALAQNPDIVHYGYFKKMIHKQNTDGVVGLQDALVSKNVFGVGATHGGTGEITVINDKLWLDYGHDGIGKSVNTVPTDEKAVLLVTASVAQWQEITIAEDLNQEELQIFILNEAKKHGLSVDKPFPFQLEGVFEDLAIHVIDGRNPHFSGQHGKGKGGLLKKIKETRTKQQGRVIGFYSAQSQGVYTHPNESWHLHVAIEDENIGAHVDGIKVTKKTVLKLPK